MVIRAPELRMTAMATAFAAGILAAEYAALVWCVLIAGAGAVLAAVLFRHFPRSTLLIVAAIFVLGALRYAASGQIAPDDISNDMLHVSAFEGTVASDPEPVKDRVRLVFRVDRARTPNGWHEASGDVLVNLYVTGHEELPNVEYGDSARITARPYAPMEQTNPLRFSWKQYLAKKGTYACASVREPSQVKLLPGRRGNPLVAGALAAKHHLANSIRRVHPEEQASLIVGIVLGTYSHLPPETFRNFSRTGTLHILAASGYNCWILLLISSPILMRLRVLPRYRNVATILLIVLYVLMVGPKPSLLRAAIMSSLLLLAMLVRRVPNTRNLFFTAALVVLIMRPSDLFDIGFQLSFAAVWALIWASPILTAVLFQTGLITTKDRPRRKWLARSVYKLGGTVAFAAVGTTAITLVTAPLVAYYFNYFSLVSIPANMALVLGVPLVFADGLASAALAPIPVVGQALGWAGTQVTCGMLGVVNCLGSTKYAAVSTASPGTLAILGYYLALYAALGYLRSRFAGK